MLEDKWAKTIAPKDLMVIKETFNTCKQPDQEEVYFTFLNEAINHRGDLLIITLVHNCKKESIQLKNETLKYIVEDKQIAIYDFSIPIQIESFTSMPWTFIFPSGTYESSKLIGKGLIII